MNHLKFIFLVVYKTKENTWRGFCSPYDVTYEAESKDEVKDELEKLVELYEEGLKKYHYPKHLSLKELSDPEDQKVFKIALAQVMDDFKRKMLKKYFESQISKKREEIKLNNIPGTASYFTPRYNYASAN